METSDDSNSAFNKAYVVGEDEQAIEMMPTSSAPAQQSASPERSRNLRFIDSPGFEEIGESDKHQLIEQESSDEEPQSDAATVQQCAGLVSELVAATQIVKRVQDQTRKMQLKAAVVFVIFVFLLPLCLLAACIFRYNFTSFIYFVFLLALPFIDSPVTCTLRGNHCLKFVIILSVLSGAAMGGQVLLEILVALRVIHLTDELIACSPTESMIRQIGFVSYQYEGVQALDVIRLFLPDLAVCFTSTLLVIIIRCILPADKRQNYSRQGSLRQPASSSGQGLLTGVAPRRSRAAPSTSNQNAPISAKQESNGGLAEFGIQLVKFINFMLILACATAAPSLLTAPYILLVLFMGTLWAFRRPVDPGETASLKVVTLAYVIAHIASLYLYQFPFLRKLLAPESFASRLIGLMAITDTNCIQPPTRLLLETDLGYSQIALPTFLFVTYAFMAFRHKITTHYEGLRRQGPSRVSLADKTRSTSTNAAAEAASTSRSTAGGAKLQQRLPSPLLEENEETAGLLKSDSQTGTGPSSVIEAGSSSNSQRAPSAQSSKHEQGIENVPGSPVARPLIPFIPFIPDAATKLFRRGESALLPAISPPPPPQYKLSPLDTLYSLFSAYSYVFSLLSMMTWSVTHFSILTLVLLVAACILWMVPNSRRACVIVSPLIVLYAKILIAIEFVYGMQLSELELKSYKEVGLVRYGTSHPGMLAAELLYLFPFWLLLRQRIDKYLASGNLNIEMTTSADTADAVTKAIQMLLVTTAISEKKSVIGSKVELNRFVLKVITFVLDQLSVYWIFLCFVMVLIQACTGTTTIINFVYMLIFMSTTFFFILSFKIWRRLLFTTCWFLCLYSMAVLLGIYIYQFEAVENWLDVNSTSHLWNDLGLNKYHTAPDLFQALILPALTLMVLVLQLQFFHLKLLRMTECVIPKRSSQHTDDDNAPSDSETQTSHDRSIAASLKDEPLIEAEWWVKTSAMFSLGLQYMWRILEVHLFKVVMIFAACLAIVQVSAVNMPLLFAVVSLLPLMVRYTNKGPRIISAIVYLGVCFAVTFKMGYQLNMVKSYTHLFEQNCTKNNDTTIVKQSLVEWIGLEESSDMLYYLQLYIILIILFLIQQIVNVRQKVFRAKYQLKPPPYGVVYPHITRIKADESVLDLIQYFVNYGFYKFGLEITWVSTIIIIATRLDAFSLVYAFPLVLQLWMPRRICARFYPFYVFFLVLLLLAEYCSCVGFPFYFTCGGYPWEPNVIDGQLRRWLVLPVSIKPTDINCTKLIGDFFQLLFATCQLSVFRIEAQYGASYDGGDNSDALPNMSMYYQNPVHDFISEKKSLLDELKAVVFELMFWITILVLFGAGVSEVNVFSLIYLIICFILLWYGQSLLIKPIDQLIRTWHIILALNVFVIIVKAGLQLLACMDIVSNKPSACNIRQVFDLICVSPSLRSSAPILECSMVPSRNPLGSDIAAFVFLLIMKRLYRSHYFQHVVRDFDIQSSLASLGASLIMHRQQEQLKREREAEKRRVDKIRTKIERIRQRQNVSQQSRDKMQSACGGAVDTVDQQAFAPRPPPDHYRVVRGGDYFMFDEKESDEEDPAALLLGGHPHNPAQAASKMEKTPIDVIADTVMKKQPSQAAASSVTHLPRVISMSLSSGGQAISPVVPPAPGEAAVQLHAPPAIEGQVTVVDSPVPTPMLPSPTEIPGQEGLKQRRIRSVSGSSQPAAGLGLSHPPTGDIEYISEVTEPGGEESEPDETLQADDQQQLDRTVTSTTSWRQHMSNAGHFLYELFYSSLTSLINLLNSLTFEHYLVRRRLKRQIEIQKTSSRRQGIVPGEVNRSRSGHRKQGSTTSAISVGSNFVSTGPISSLALPAMPPAVSAAGQSVARQAITAVTSGELPPYPTYIPQELTEEEEMNEREEIENELRNHSLPYRLIRSIFDLFLAKTEYVCYLLMVLTFLLEGSILSLPLPLFAFSWGMLAIPSPGHRFWITVMTYEMLVVIVKFIFQFPLGYEDIGQAEARRTAEMPWQTFNDVAKLFGVNKRNNFALLDILLLVSLFLHRFMLKRYGLWKPAEVPPVEQTPISPSGNNSKNASIVTRQPEPAQSSKSLRKTSTKNNSKSAPQISVTSISDTGDQQSISLMDAAAGDSVDPELIDADIESEAVGMDSDSGCCWDFCYRIRAVPSLIVLFFTQLTNPTDRSPRDLYAFIFAADFCALLTTVFAYDKFGPSNYKAQAVLELLQSDVVPIPFVILLLVQFSFLLIDRALYIRKLAVGKLIFQIFLLILVHVITLFVLPLPTVTNIPFSQNAAVQVWYFFKCAYFGFSAYQIKFGYPQHVATHFLTRQYNYLMWLLLKGFMVIPFLLELRTIMDWVFTRTTLSFRYWLITDLCYYEVFSIKCDRQMEQKYPTLRGNPRAWMYKIHGLLFLAGIVFILWFPFLLFSFGDLMVMPADMTNVRLDIRLSGSSQSLFVHGVDVESGGLYRMNDKQYEALVNCFKNENQQLSYTSSDIWIAKIGSNSQSLWTLSPPAYESLELTLQNESLVNMSVSTTFTVNRRAPKTRNSPSAPSYNNKLPMTNETRSSLLKLLQNTTKPSSVLFPSIMPQYLIVDRSGSMDAFQLPGCPQNKQSYVLFFNAAMSLTQRSVEERWWSSNFSRTQPQCDCQELQLSSGNETEVVVISAPVKAEVLSLLDRLGTSIIGVYSAVVLVVHRLLRSSLIEGANYRVMFTELPRCDRVWRLLNEIYIVRQFGEWQLEEELVARLIFLYRSPQTMIDQTRQVGLM